MSVLADTNILLRIAQRNHSQYEHGTTVYFTLQNIAEFWNVATRPMRSNGFGYATTFAVQEIGKIENLPSILPDSPYVYLEWKRLVTKYEVLGVKVHNARLVATMLVHGVEQLLTFDTGDFARYSEEINVIHPETLLRTLH